MTPTSRCTFQYLSLALLVLIALCLLFLSYSNSFHGVWLYDDYSNIINNESVHFNEFNFKNIKDLQKKALLPSRPLAYLTFALNYSFGKLDTFGYHIVNFIIHLLTTIFLFLFQFNTLTRSKFLQFNFNNAFIISLLSTLMWTVHPIQVTSVTYIVQRMASMSAMFYITALFFYSQARFSNHSIARIIYFFLSLLSGIMGLLSKEIIVTLPLLILIWDLIFIQGASRANLIKFFKIFLYFLLGMLILELMKIIDLYKILAIDDYQTRPYSLKERLLTEPRIILFYLSLIFYPLENRFSFIHDYNLSGNLFSPPATFFAILLIILLCIYSFAQAKKNPVFSFTLLFYFFNHVLEGTVIPILIIFEHRNYLPSFFLFLPVCIFIINSLKTFSPKSISYLLTTFLILFISYEGYVTYERNNLFKSPESFWEDNYDKFHDSYTVNQTLSAEYLKKGDIKKGIFHLKKSLNSKITDYKNAKATAHLNLGKYYENCNKPDLALKEYLKAKSIAPAYDEVYYQFALLHTNQFDYATGIENIKTAIKLAPNKPEYPNTYAMILLLNKNSRKAFDIAFESHQFFPDNSDLLLTLGEIEYARKNYENSAGYFEQSLKLDNNLTNPKLALIELYSLLKNDTKLIQIIKFLNKTYSKEQLNKLINDFDLYFNKSDEKRTLTIKKLLDCES